MTASAVSGEIRVAERDSKRRVFRRAVTVTQLTGDQWVGPSVRMQADGSSEQEEIVMVDELVPWVKANLATTGTEQNWLMGLRSGMVGRTSS